MLILPYLFGMVWACGAGQLSVVQVGLGFAWFVGYFAFFAAATWLKSRFKPRYRDAVVTYSAVAGVLVVLVLLGQVGWWTWGLVFGPLTGIGLWLAWRRRERSLASGLVTVAAASLMPLVIGSQSIFELGGLPTLAGTAAVCFGYFFGTVLYVKTNIRERGRKDYIGYSVAWHVLCAIAMGAMDLGLARWWLVAFFVLCTVRAYVVPMAASRGRAVTAKHLGIGEFVVTAILAAIVVPGLLAA